MTIDIAALRALLVKHAMVLSDEEFSALTVLAPEDAIATAEVLRTVPALLDRLEAHQKNASGLCSAHSRGEDPTCMTCYGIGPQGAAREWVEIADREKARAEKAERENADLKEDLADETRPDVFRAVKEAA